MLTPEYTLVQQLQIFWNAGSQIPILQKDERHATDLQIVAGYLTNN